MRLCQSPTLAICGNADAALSLLPLWEKVSPKATDEGAAARQRGRVAQSDRLRVSENLTYADYPACFTTASAIRTPGNLPAASVAPAAAASGGPARRKSIPAGSMPA